MKKILVLIFVVLMLGVYSFSWAEETSNSAMQDEMSGMDHDAMSDDHVMDQQHAAVTGSRDPHAYADGYDFGPIPRPRFADEQSFASLLVDRLEAVHTTDVSVTAYDLQAWYGRDIDRALLKAEGDVDNGTVQEARTELLWNHAVLPFWDTQVGLRVDSGEAPDRTWLAVGVQGLAPYWFEVTATAYVGDQSRSALRLDGEYELLLSQKLILQPRLEADFYGKEDAEHGQGSGFSDLVAGLRLRYEIRRELAPYVGVEWSSKYGNTADYARAVGESANETRWVAGIRFWF